MKPQNDQPFLLIFEKPEYAAESKCRISNEQNVNTENSGSI